MSDVFANLRMKLPFPWLVTTLHATCTSIGCLMLLRRKAFEVATLTSHEHLVIVLFSVLFTINIAMSNISLYVSSSSRFRILPDIKLRSVVSLPFHQTARSTTPIFVTLIQWLVYSQSTSIHVYLSLIFMTIGIAIATYGDYYFTMMGFCLTMSGVLLSAVKVRPPCRDQIVIQKG